MAGVVQVSVANQTVTNTSGSVTFNESSTGDTITGGVGDSFVFQLPYVNYNTITDISGGTLLGGVNNAFIGLAGNFGPSNGITAIGGNGYSGVTVSDNAAVLNLSGVALSNVTIAANQYTAQTITSTSVGGSYNVSGNNATINGAGHDTFTVVTPYASEFNTYNEPTGGVILAGANNAFIGMGGNVVNGNGIAAILSNGYSGATVGGNSAVLNLAGVRISGVAIDADQANQTITTTQGNLNYTVSSAGDTFNGVGGDTFSVVDTYNNYNAYNDLSGGTVQAGVNNALLAFSNSLTSADGIATLSANGHTGVNVSSQGAVLNTTGIALNGVGISLTQNGQIVTVPQTGLNYTVSTYGDTINAGGGDTFTVADSYIEYNAYNDVAGGTVQAGTDNALLGFSNSLTAADGISTLSANGHAGVHVGSNGAVLNLTGITLNGVGIDLSQTGQTVTAPQTGLNYRVSNYNDVINGGGNDTFTVVDSYNNYNTYNDVSGGTVQAGTNNALLGFTNSLTAADGISTLSANGYTGVNVASNGAVLNLTGITLNGVGVSLAQTGQTVMAPQSGLNYKVSNYNDIINGGGNDTFTVVDSYNNFNTYNDIAGGTVQAGTNNALLGFTNSLTAADGISTLSANGYTGVMVASQGAVLNLTGITLNGVGISAGQGNQVITAPQSGLNYKVTNTGDTFNGGGNDTFTVDDVYTYANTYNDVAGGTIQAGMTNAVIGLAGNFGAGNGIATISGNGYTGVTITGNTAGATLDFSQTNVSDATIRGGANNVTIIGPSGNQTLTGGGQSDVFAFTAGTGNDVITDFRAGSGGGFDVIDLNGALSVPNFATLLTHIQQVGANAVITLNNGGTITLDNVNVSSLKANNFNLGNVATGLSAGNGTVTVGHGQSVNLSSAINSLITQGTLDGVATTTSLTALTATSGTAAMVSGNANYTAPASGSDTASYTATDQFGDVVSGQIAVTVDVGPTVASGALTIGHGQSQDVTALINSLITKGIAGDTETVTSTSGNLVQNAQGNWIYTAPASGNANATFTVTDQLGDTATGQIAVTVNTAPQVIAVSGINPSVTNTSGGNIFNVTAMGGTIVGGASDVFNVNIPYVGHYNSYQDSLGGQIQAGMNNAFIGLSGNFSAAANGINTISGNGHSGVVIADNGGTLNLSGVTLSDVTIETQSPNQQIIGSSAGGDNFIVGYYGNVITGYGQDTFTDTNAYVAYNTISDVSGGTILAGNTNAFIGLAGNFTPLNGISTISANGYTGVAVAGNGAVLNLSGTTLSPAVTIDAFTPNQIVTGPAAQGQNFVVTANNVTLNGSGNDTFNVNNTSTYSYDTYNDVAGGTILAGENNAFIGLAGNFSAASGISTISANGYSGVEIAGLGTSLNLSGVTVTGIKTILVNQTGETVVGPATTGLTYNVYNFNDSVTGAGGDTFVVDTPYPTYYNSYTDVAGGGTIAAGMTNAFIGLSGNFGPSNGISTISGNGYTGVTITGNTAGATLDFSQTNVSDATIRGGANNVTIIGPSGNQTLTGGGQSDVFAFTAGTGNDVITDFRAGSGGGFDVIDLNGALSVPNFATLLTHIQQVGANAVITLNNGGTITLDNVNVSSLKANNFNLGNVATGLSAGNGTVTVGHGQSVNLSSAINSLITQGTLDGVATTTSLTALTATSGTAAMVSGNANYTAPASGSDTASYTATDQFGDVVSGQIAVTVDVGPTVASGALTIGHGQSQDVTALINSLITKGIAGDTETVTSTSGNLVQNAQGNWIYTAPASGNANATFTVTDQHGDVASGQIAVTVDAGPSTAGVVRSINLSTGQNAAGVVQQTNDSLDANWQITGAAAPQDAPNAYVVASNALDFGYGGWMWNDASSTWIAAAPNDPHGNGNMTATDTFTLSASDIAHISVASGAFAADDTGTIYINGHELASAVNAWANWTSFTIPTADLVVGTNTLSLVTSNGDYELEGLRVHASIQIGQSGYLTIGHGQSQDVTALINSLITAGAAGDTETVTSNSGDLVKNAQGHWIYTAPNGQTSDTPTFTVTDQFGNSTTGSIAVTIDQGPVAANASIVVGHNQNAYLTTVINNLITPGLPTDTETVTAVSGAHAFLGGGNVIYGSPSSGSGSFTYTVTDQLGETATGTVNVKVDTGPAVAKGTLTVGHGQSEDVTSLINGLITKGVVGDTETVASTSGDLVKNAQGEWIYTAPITGSPNATFTVTDQLGDAASGQIAVTVDAGPVVANGTLTTTGSSVDETAYLKSLVTPGISGDTETITAVSGNATLGANGSVTYTPTSAASSSFTYTVTDEYGDTAIGTVNVTQQQPAPVVTPPVVASHSGTVVNLSGSNAVVTGPVTPTVASGVAGANVTGPAAGFATITGPASNVTITAQGYDNTITAGGGNDIINAGLDGANVTVSDGSGRNIVTDALGTLSDNVTVTLGDGNDSVTLRGYDNAITLGNGNNIVNAGAGIETVTLGNGNNSVTAGGYNNVITAGSGTNTINAGLGNDLVTLAGGPATVTINGYSNSVSSTGGGVSISGDNGYSNIILVGENNTLVLGGFDEHVTVGLNGTGNNSICGSMGTSVIVTGAGNQTISAGGYFNSITTGAGNSTIEAGAGYDTVDVGAGVNTINAHGNNNTITTHGGSNTVNLDGWNNTINVSSGVTVVGGGYENTYNVTALSTDGGLEVTDFNAPYGDVLNLDAVLKPLAVGGQSLSSLVSAHASGNNLLISINTANGPVQVADLNGLASATLTGLIASHSLML